MLKEKFESGMRGRGRRHRRLAAECNLAPSYGEGPSLPLAACHVWFSMVFQAEMGLKKRQRETWVEFRGLY